MWTVPDRWSYSYSLGMCLGDGWVGRVGRSTRLMVSLDTRYHAIIEDTIAAAQLAAPHCRLIHSDGCRTVNRFKTKLPSGRVAEYEYPRYFFSNLSADIRALFCEYCERLGVRWTQSNHRNISVSHRHSVAILDALIGPKC